MKTKISLMLVVAILFISCDCKNGNGNGNDNNGNGNELIPIEAVDTLIIGSNSFILDAFLWRDFMPISPPDGQPMISINWLICTNEIAIPDNISLVKQFVIFGDLVWKAYYTDEEGVPQPAHKIQRVSRNGPKWGPNIYVDVIAQVYDSNTNKTHFVRRKNVFVIRTS